jgi:two-component system LytT family sensor kinase
MWRSLKEVAYGANIEAQVSRGLEDTLCPDMQGDVALRDVVATNDTSSHPKTSISRHGRSPHTLWRNNKTMLRFARLRIVILGWAGASLLFTAVLEISELGHKRVGFALYSNAVHFALWALSLPLFVACIRRFPLKAPKRIQNGTLRLLLVGVLAPLVALIHWTIVFPTYFPYRSSDPTFSVVLRSELPRFLPDEVLIGVAIVIAIEAWEVLKDLHAERMRGMDLERQLVVSRLEALRVQLPPHFLFNTLHAVAGLTVEDPPTARRMVIALGDLLRITLRETNGQVRTLAEELEYSDLYLGIEKLRLGDRLLINYDIEPAAARALVPRFLLQPIFENAICHGASRMTAPCEIHFSATCKRNTLEIVICNDGPKQIQPSSRLRFGIGLTNTMDRLRIHYGEHHTFKYCDRPEGGARIEISLPQTDAGDCIKGQSSIGEPPAARIGSDRDNRSALREVGHS